MATAPVTVILCDDDPLARDSLATYLATAQDITLLSTHDNAADAIAAVAEQQPDVLLSDIRMPCLDGIHAARTIHHQHPHTRVLLITSFDDTNTLDALQAGAAGYVLKTVTPTALVEAIHAVAQGLTVVSAGPLDDLVPPATPGQDTPIDLTPAERDVLRLLCQGQNNAAIAEQLYQSVSTTKRHLTNAMRKLGTTSRLTTVLEAQRLHLT